MTKRNQRYPAESKASALQEGRSIKLKTQIKPRTFGQEFYLSNLQECTITLATGPAGCGKTWLATQYALTQLLDNKIEKIIVTKPILEAAGEVIGALPGEIEDKIGPHFQSVIDCFDDHIGPAATKKLIDTEKIIFLPVAYARGRSIKNAYIIVDEAQNLTRNGLRLMMSRISTGSSMAINGDSDQIDLPKPADSGLAWAISALSGKDAEIGVVQMTERDIQRHRLIGVILKALR